MHFCRLGNSPDLCTLNFRTLLWNDSKICCETLRSQQMAVVVQDDQDVQTLRVALHFAVHQQALQQLAPAVPNPPEAQPAPALPQNHPLAAWPSPAALAPAPALQISWGAFFHKDFLNYQKIYVQKLLKRNWYHESWAKDHLALYL